MLALTQMNGEHITPRIRAQESWSDVTYEILEEARLQLQKADWGCQVWGGGSEAAGRGKHWKGWACSRAPLWW